MRMRAVLAGLVLGLLFGAVMAVSGSASPGPLGADRARAAGADPADGARARSARRPTRLFVNAKEWSLILSRLKLRSGRAIIQLYNGGEDAHDLRLRRVGGKRTLRIGETEPGELSQLEARLRRGRWKLWCSLPGHRKLGMRATLRVRR